MPTTPVRTAGEPLTRQDARDLVTFLETGRSPNPHGHFPARAIDAVLQTDFPVSGHGDDIYLYEEDDLTYRDSSGRVVQAPRLTNPASSQSHENQPPDPKWRLKTTLPDMSLEFERQGGEIHTATWKGMALLQNGNSKVQCYNWSIPEGASCPGRSAFCSSCYAVDMAAGSKRATMMGSRVMRLKAWAEKREEWLAEMIAECQHYGEKAPIRLHVAGDFFNAEYTRDWIKVIKASPRSHFWAYTRSWAADQEVPGGRELVEALEHLRRLPNMTLYASFDPTMRTPPEDWLWAGIYGDPRLGWKRNRRTGQRVPRPIMICPEIAGTTTDWKHIGEDGSGAPPLFGKEPHRLPARATCRTCGWCWNKDTSPPTPSKVAQDIEETGVRPMVGARGDVAFPRHGSILELPIPGTIEWPLKFMPTREQVKTYSIFRNGKQQDKVTRRWKYGEGNHVGYSDAMLQSGREAEKVREARKLADMETGRGSALRPRDVLYTKDVVDKETGRILHRKGEVQYHKGTPVADSYMAQFYREEFDKLLAGTRVAAKQIEQYWEV